MLLELTLIPRDQVDDLRPARLHAGQAVLPAEPIRGFGKNDAVAAFCRNARRLQPGRTAADHEYPLWLLRWREADTAPFPFAADRGDHHPTYPVAALPTPPTHPVDR